MISIGTGIWRGPPGVNVAGGVTARADVPIVSLDVAGFWPGVTELGLNAQVGMYCACTCTSVVTAHVRATAFAKPNVPVAEIVEVVEENAEFISTHASECITGPDIVEQPLREFDQQLISSQMPQRVVDTLEAIQVEEQDSKRALSPSLPPGHRLAHVIHVQGAVR